MSDKNYQRLHEIMKYLWKNTDKNNLATVKQIQAYLESVDLKADRKTIYKDIEFLSSLDGIDIECELKQQNNYYISRRFIPDEDIKIICDTIRTSYFISEKKSDELVKDFRLLLGPTSIKEVRESNLIDSNIRTHNNSVVKNVDKINKAISSNKKIRFKYFEYDMEKKKLYKHSKYYTVSPYAISMNDGKYYIAAFDDDAGKIKTFRIDKMDSLKVLVIERVAMPKEFKISDFAEQTRMLDGVRSDVELLCDSDMMYAIIDKFGPKLKTEIVDDSHFKVFANTIVSSTFFGWVVGYDGKIKVIGPINILKEYNNTLSKCID